MTARLSVQKAITVKHAHLVGTYYTGGTVDPVDSTTIARTAQSMRLLLDAVNAGTIQCPPSSQYHLEGLVTALEAMSSRP